MKLDIFPDLECWGLGFDIGKTQFSPFRFFASVQVFCFVAVVWFGKKGAT